MREDSYKHQGLRKRLVESLSQKGIEDDDVLDAMETVPRHLFLAKDFEEWAYRDKPLPIEEDQTISQPYTVAYQTQLLNIEPRQKVLEVGTGSGYQAAILAKLGARVFTVERHEALYKKAKALLYKLELHNVRCYLRDGWKGLPEFAPFDRIIVTAGAKTLPDKLLKQLAVGGIMVVPVGKSAQRMYRITRTDEDTFETEKLDTFQFVPMLKGISKKKSK